MMDAAMAISFTGKKAQRTPEEIELDEMRGEKVADRLEDDPRFQAKMVMADPANGIEASNPPGSFEALMGGWGMSSHGRALDTSPARAQG